MRRLTTSTSYRVSQLLVGILLVCPRAFASEVLDDAAASVQSGLKTEVIKTGMAALVHAARSSNPKTADEAAKETAEAIERLQMNVEETKAFFKRLQGMNSAELSRLVKQRGNGILAYGQALLSGEGRDLARVKAALAEGGDKAGLEAARLVRRLEEGLPVDKATLTKALKALPPEKSTTLLEAFRSEFKRGGPIKKQLMDSVGTMVDGVFVFNDAVNIYYSDAPPEEKAAAATGKAVEFGASSAGGVVVAALGGGLGAGLLLGWSAGQVGELTQEIIGLSYDRQNAAMQEQWARLELREMTLRKMLEVDALIKSGKIDKALDQSKKLRQFYDEHEAEIGDSTLGTRLEALRTNLSQASHKQTALVRLNEARRPYERAFIKYSKRHSLKAALQEAREARKILEPWVKLYPELNEALTQVRNLESEIAQAIANATPVKLAAIRGSSRVALGQWATFYLEAAGGIPLYCGVPDGPCGDTYATTYWRATGKLGKRTVNFRLKDDLGRTAAKELEIDVVSTENAADSGSDDRPGVANTGKPGMAEDASNTPLCQRAKACCMKQMRSQMSGDPEKLSLYCRTNSRMRASCEWWDRQAACK